MLSFVCESVHFHCYELAMKWSRFQRDMQDICLHILLTASDPNGEKHLHEKGKLYNGKDPSHLEETMKTFQIVCVDDRHLEMF